MRKVSILLVLGLICLSINFLSWSLPVQSAGEPTGFTNVTLWVYPEYDDPRLLVMLEGQVSGATAPVPVRFLVPSTAEMYSAGSKDAQGAYSGGPPDRKPSAIAGWDEISYTLKTTTFRVEYYDPIIPAGTDKTISYDFRTLYPISDMAVVVQVPTQASAFSVVPAGTKGTEGSFSVYTYQYSSATPDQPLNFSISYTKTDPNPSIGQAANPATGNNSTSSTRSNFILAASIIGGVVILVLLFLWFVRFKRNKTAVKVSAVQRTDSKKPRSKYCGQCGKPLDYQSKFCPYCGNKIDH